MEHTRGTGGRGSYPRPLRVRVVDLGPNQGGIPLAGSTGGGGPGASRLLWEPAGMSVFPKGSAALNAFKEQSR